MVVYVKNRAGKKLCCIVERLMDGSDHNYTTDGALEQVTKVVASWFAETLAL